MPTAELRQLRRRIHSVESTRKITGAMALVATSRVARAQQRVVAARPYSQEITRVVANLTAAAPADHPLLRRREPIGRMGLVIVGGDRGLAGAYNGNVLRRAESHRATVGREAALFVVGRKAAGHFRYRGDPIQRAYAGLTDRPTYEDARRVAADVLAAFGAGDVDAVDVVTTLFLSVATQRVTLFRLLPVEVVAAGGRGTRYELEPGEPTAILDRLLPRYVEARLFSALLDAAASEHAARQRAMTAATDNADELIKTLTRMSNRVRQTEITTQLVEIVGGAQALRRCR